MVYWCPLEITILFLKNDTDVADYNFDGDQPILIMLLREYAIKR